MSNACCHGCKAEHIAAAHRICCDTVRHLEIDNAQLRRQVELLTQILELEFAKRRLKR